MKKSIFHTREAETIEAKTRWFQTLSYRERAEYLDSFVEIILEVNPRIVEQKDAQPVEGRIRVVKKP